MLWSANKRSFWRDFILLKAIDDRGVELAEYRIKIIDFLGYYKIVASFFFN